MKANFPKLRFRQLDAVLELWRSADLPPHPLFGWIGAICDGLGMSATYLAGRLGVATSAVTRLVQTEADETISLVTPRRAADPLGCELKPRPPPQKRVRSKPMPLSNHCAPVRRARSGKLADRIVKANAD